MSTVDCTYNNILVCQFFKTFFIPLMLSICLCTVLYAKVLLVCMCLPLPLPQLYTEDGWILRCINEEKD
jgi:hypothetical protein